MSKNKNAYNQYQQCFQNIKVNMTIITNNVGGREGEREGERWREGKRLGKQYVHKGNYPRIYPGQNSGTTRGEKLLMENVVGG